MPSRALKQNKVSQQISVTNTLIETVVKSYFIYVIMTYAIIINQQIAVTNTLIVTVIKSNFIYFIMTYEINKNCFRILII